MSIEVKCLVADEKGQWQETLRVRSLDTAEEDVKSIIQEFNETLRPGELPRHLVQILKEKKLEDKSRGDKIKDFHDLLTDLRHEHCNAYGSVWLKSKFPLIMKSYDTLLETGKSRMLNKYIRECFANLRDIPERLHYLKDVDIVALFKENP